LIDYGKVQQQLDFFESFFFSAVDFAAAYDYLDNFTPPSISGLNSPIPSTRISPRLIRIFLPAVGALD
jgi:hypothetical protein